VLLSAAIALLSTLLAVMLLLSDPILLLYYFLSTLAFTAITYFMKRPLYRVIVAGESENSAREKRATSSRKIMLITFLILLGSLMIPLLLSGLLGGAIWVIMITSYASGVSLSEIVIYMQTQGL
jgi:hypothetical protein